MKISFIIATLFLLSALIPVVSAHSDGMHVIMTGQDHEYDTNEDATVQVHVFEKGELADPDQSPDMEFQTDLQGNGETREIPASKVSMGLYEGDVSIHDSDLEDSRAGAALLKDTHSTPDGDRYSLSMGRNNDSDDRYDFVTSGEAGVVPIFLKWKEGFDVSYALENIEDYPWESGETVSFAVDVSDHGTPVKPSEFRLSQSRLFGTDDPIDVPWDNPSDGHYEAQFTVPSDLKEQTTYTITANAVEGDKTSSVSFQVPVYMYQVWYHELSTSTKDQRNFGLYVADMDGKPVEGAQVGISYMSSDFTYLQRTGLTNPDGKADFSVKNMKDDIYINGWASVGERNQSFSGVLYYGVVSEGGDSNMDPSPYGFDVDMPSSEYQVDSGKISHDLVAFKDGERMYNAGIYWYAYTAYAILGHGSTRTNQKGEFTLTFDAPANKDQTVYIDLENATGPHPGVFHGYNWTDSDHDGYSDAFEEHVGSDPHDEQDVPCSYMDSDADQFGDRYEEYMGTDPNNSSSFPSDHNDTDGDGFGDEFEIDQGTSPTAFWDHPGRGPDNDSDSHSNAEELFYGTDPDNASDYPHDSYIVNTDGDHVGSWFWDIDEQYDKEEIFYGTDPTNPDDYPYNIYGNDTDHDGVCDVEEQFYGTDPVDPSSSPDSSPDPWDPLWDDHNSTDGMLYEDDTEALYPQVDDILDLVSSDDVRISVDSFRVGGASKLSLEDVPPSATGMLGIFYVASVSDMEDHRDSSYNFIWEPWTIGNGIPLYDTGNDHSGMILTPSFLPSGDQEFFIVGGYNDSGDQYLNHLVVRNGDTKSAGGGGSNDGALLGFGALALIPAIIAVVVLLIVVLLVIIIIVVMVVRGRKKAVGARDDAGGDPSQRATYTPVSPGESTPPPPPPADDTPPPPSD